MSENNQLLGSQGFDDWAGNYDTSINQHQKGYPFEGYYEVLAQVQSLCKLLKGKNILDIGIGTGLLTQQLYQNGANITGLDFSQKMLDLAKQKMPQATLIQHDFAKGLPEVLPKNQYHHIISSYALHHLEDDAKVHFLLNCKNLLQEKGSILIGDISFDSSQAMEQCKTQTGKGWDNSEFYFNAEKMIPKLEQAGFKVSYHKISMCGGVYHLSY